MELPSTTKRPQKKHLLDGHSRFRCEVGLEERGCATSNEQDEHRLPPLLSSFEFDSRLPSEQASQARERNHISYDISPYGINLPSGMDMSEEKISYICESLKKVMLERK